MVDTPSLRRRLSKRNDADPVLEPSTVCGVAAIEIQVVGCGRRDERDQHGLAVFALRAPRRHAPGAVERQGLSAGKLSAMELALQITLLVTSVLVVLLVLLHRAKGGGLSTLFGGGVQSSLSGSAVVEKNLDRLTLFVTGIWLVSIIAMALLIKYR